MYSEEGTLQPTKKSMFIWGVLMAVLAATMLLASDDGLTMMQTLSIVAAFPFTFIMLAAMPATMKALKEDYPVYLRNTGK